MTAYTLETGVLAGLLTHPKRIPDALDLLTADDFADKGNSSVMAAIIDMHAQGGPVNVFTVTDAIRPELPALADTLAGLAANAPDAAATLAMARELREASMRRRLVSALEGAADAANGKRPVPELVDDLMAELYGIGSGTAGKRPEAIKDGLTRFSAWLDDKTPERAHKLGWSRLDGMVGGMRPGNLVLLAARPGVGKSALGGDIALKLAKGGVKTVIFSCEMSEMELVQRLVARESGAPLGELISRKLGEGGRESVAEAAGAMSPLPLEIYDAPGITTQNIRRILQAERGVGFIVVDYIQLLRPTGKSENRNLEIGKISGELKGIAKEFDIPVLALSQLNRAKDADDEPALTDLRESGSLEQDSDKVIMLWRIGKDGGGREKLAVKVAKNRMGRTGYCIMHFDGSHMLFTESAETYLPKRKGKGARFEPAAGEPVPWG